MAYGSQAQGATPCRRIDTHPFVRYELLTDFIDGQTKIATVATIHITTAMTNLAIVPSNRPTAAPVPI